MILFCYASATQKHRNKRYSPKHLKWLSTYENIHNKRTKSAPQIPKHNQTLLVKGCRKMARSDDFDKSLGVRNRKHGLLDKVIFLKFSLQIEKY